MNTLKVGILFSIVDGYSREANSIRSQFQDIGEASEQLSEKVNGSMLAISAGMLAVNIGTKLLGSLGQAVKVSSVFNKEISKVGALARANRPELEAMKQAALDLGKSTEWSAKQAAEGMSFLAMAGFSASDTVKAMPGLLNLASAGSLQLARASDIASNILSTFNIKASESNRVADVLALSSTRANTSVQQMGDAMKYLGPTAASLGVSLEESAAAIGMLGDFGLQGSMATSTLSSAMLRFTKPTGAMKAMMKKLNMSVFDSQGKFKGLAGMLEEVEKATKGMTQEQKANVLATLFGSRAYKNVSSLLSAQKEVIIDGKKETLKGSAALRGFTKEMEKAGGAAKRIADQKLDNYAGDMTKMASATEGLMITIGDALEPLLRPIVQFFTALISRLNIIMDSPIGTFITVFAGGLGVLLVALGGVLIATKLYAYANILLALVMKALGQEKIKQSFLDKGLLAGMKKLTKQTFGQIKALFTMRSALIALSTVGVLVVIYGIVEGLQSFQKAVKEGKVATGGLTRFLQQVGGVIIGVWNALKSFDGKTFNFGGVGEALKNLGIMETVKGIISWGFRLIEIWRGIGGAFVDVFNVIKVVVQFLAKMLGSAIAYLFNNFGLGAVKIRRATASFAQMRAMGKVLGYVIMGLLVPAFFSWAVAVIAATWPILAVIAAIALVVVVVRNWGAITDWVGRKFDDFVKWVSSGVQKIIKWFKGLGPIIISRLGQFLDWLAKLPDILLSAFASGISKITSLVGQAVSWLVSSFFSFLKWTIKDVPLFLINAFFKGINLVINLVGWAVSWLLKSFFKFLLWLGTDVPVFLHNAFTKGVSFIVSVVSGGVSWLLNKFLEFTNWMTTTLPRLLADAFVVAVDWAIGIVSGFINWMFAAIPQLLSWIWNSVTTTIPNAFLQAFNYIIGLAGKLWETLSGWADGFVDLGKNLMDALWKGLKSVWTNIKGWATNAFSFFTGGGDEGDGSTGIGNIGASDPNARTTQGGLAILDRGLSQAALNRNGGAGGSRNTKETIIREERLNNVTLKIDMDGETIAQQTNNYNADMFNRSND